MSRHRIPNEAFVSKPVEVDDEYQAEIDRSVNALTRRYKQAAKHLAALERRAENGRRKAVEHEAAQARHLVVAENRAESERLLTTRLLEIKAAAKASRVNAARAQLEAQRAQAEVSRRAATVERKEQLRLARGFEQRIKQARRDSLTLDGQIEDRRRELREIEQLMLPTSYSNRDSKARRVRHETGRA